MIPLPSGGNLHRRCRQVRAANLHVGDRASRIGQHLYSTQPSKEGCQSFSRAGITSRACVPLSSDKLCSNYRADLVESFEDPDHQGPVT